MMDEIKIRILFFISIFILVALLEHLAPRRTLTTSKKMRWFSNLTIYLQHVMFHAIPIFWRLHMMHRADLDYDLTTGLRFHPIEIILSMGIKVSVVAILGPPVALDSSLHWRPRPTAHQSPLMIDQIK